MHGKIGTIKATELADALIDSLADTEDLSEDQAGSATARNFLAVLAQDLKAIDVRVEKAAQILNTNDNEDGKGKQLVIGMASFPVATVTP